MEQMVDGYGVPDTARVLVASVSWEEANRRPIEDNEIIFNGTMGEFRNFKYYGNPVEVFFRVRSMEINFQFETSYILQPVIEVILPEQRKLRE